MNDFDPTNNADADAQFQDPLISLLESTGQRLPLPKPPEALTRSLQDLFQGRAEVQWADAQLIHDSRSGEPLVGARGSSDRSVWTATYCAPNADLVIDGVHESDGSIITSGQIFPLDTGSSAFSVSVNGPTSMSAYTDDLGQFELGSLPPGEYTLQASNDRHGLRLTFDNGIPKYRDGVR